MKRPPLYCCLSFRIGLGSLLLPPLLWTALLGVVPTECARKTVEARLSAATGRTVTLGKVRVGFRGGLQLEDLSIGAAGSSDDPWFKVAGASIDVCLAQLLLGKIDPSDITLRGLRLRLLRRADGRLELADLLGSGPTKASGTTTTAPADGPSRMTVRVAGAQVLLIDETSGTRLELTDVEGVALRRGEVIQVSDVRGTVNGGTFLLAAQVDTSGDEPAFEGELRTSGVGLGEGMGALEYLVPVLAGTPPKLTGKLGLDLYLKAHGWTRERLLSSMVGHGQVGLDPIDLDGSRLMASLRSLVDKPSTRHVGAVSSSVVIREGRVASDNLKIDLGRVPVELAGWTDFEGRLDYHPKAEGLAERLQARGQDLLSRLKIDLTEVEGVKIQGTLDHQVVTVNGTAVDDPARLKDVARRLRDQTTR